MIVSEDERWILLCLMGLDVVVRRTSAAKRGGGPQERWGGQAALIGPCGEPFLAQHP